MMRSMKVVMLAAVLLATILVSAEMAEDSISLGSLELTLGTSEQAIRARLPKNYTLELDTPSPGSGVVTGLVFSKPGRLVENLLGNVRFQGGKLISASRDSGLGDVEEGVGLARTLYSVVHGLTKDRERSCLVRTWQSQDIVNAQIKGITIKCGKEYVELHIGHPYEGRAFAGIRQGVQQ